MTFTGHVTRDVAHPSLWPSLVPSCYVSYRPVDSKYYHGFAPSLHSNLVLLSGSILVCLLFQATVSQSPREQNRRCWVLLPLKSRTAAAQSSHPKSRTAAAGCSPPKAEPPLLGAPPPPGPGLVMVMPFLRPARALLQCIVCKAFWRLTRTNFNLHAALIAPVSTQECSRVMFPCTRLNTDHELCLAFKYPTSYISNVEK